MTTITVVFDPPLPTDDPATFDSKAFGLVSDLNTFATEANLVASEINAAAAVGSQAITDVEEFNTRWLGYQASNPSVDGNGDPVTSGALYYNSTLNVLRVFKTSSWGDAVALYPFAGGTYSVSYGNMAPADWGGATVRGLEVSLSGNAQSAVAVSSTNSFLVSNCYQNGADWFSTHANGSTRITHGPNIFKFEFAAPTSAGTNITSNFMTCMQLGYSGTDEYIDTTGAIKNTPFTNNTLSFNLLNSSNFNSTISAGGTLTFTNMATRGGQSGYIRLVNGSNYAITAHANTKISTLSLASISVTGTYLLSYYCDGTDVYISLGNYT